MNKKFYIQIQCEYDYPNDQENQRNTDFLTHVLKEGLRTINWDNFIFSLPENMENSHATGSFAIQLKDENNNSLMNKKITINID